MHLPGRILIADCDENVLLTTTDLLQSAGYQCTPVRDGVEALQALVENEYDLLITEIRVSFNEDLECGASLSRTVLAGSNSRAWTTRS